MSSQSTFQKSSSEWNSLLLTARAQRGPQWDITTQQSVFNTTLGVHICSQSYPSRFQVDRGSHLYYDPAPLAPNVPPSGAESTPPPESRDERNNNNHQGRSMPPQTPNNMNGGTYRDLVSPQQYMTPGMVASYGQGMQHNNNIQLNGMGDPMIPPEGLRNPRRTTRGMNGREGMYRI